MQRRTKLFVLAGSSVVALAAFGGQRAAVAVETTDAKIELGRRLFFDPAVGRAGLVACAACHDPDRGFSDARRVSQDEHRILPRHSQPLTDLGGSGFHWDGEFDTVREVIDARIAPGLVALNASAQRSRQRLQTLAARADEAHAPMPEAISAALDTLGAGGTYGSDEFDVKAALANGDLDGDRLVRRGRNQVGVAGGVASGETVAARFARLGVYEEGFRAAFGDGAVSTARIGDALEAYVTSLRTPANAYDRHAAGDAAALAPAAQRGLEVFRGKAGCVQCHAADGDRAAFTDRAFHNTGVAARASDKSASGLGRAAADFDGASRGAFKTPSLRDVAVRAPYMHDGSFATLRDVVDYYDGGGTANTHLDPKITKLGLTAGERDDLVQFLQSLTGEERAGLGAPSADRPATITVHVETPEGAPVAGREVTLTPHGDRLAGTSEMPGAVTTLTNIHGDAVFPMPLATHVVATAAGAAPTPFLPDWTSRARMVTTPERGLVAIVAFDADAERPETFRTFVGDTLSAQAPLVFRKLRDLGGAESIYAADGKAVGTGTAQCVVCVAGAPKSSQLDLTAGAVNRLDVRRARQDGRAIMASEVSAAIADIAKFAPSPDR